MKSKHPIRRDSSKAQHTADRADMTEQKAYDEFPANWRERVDDGTVEFVAWPGTFPAKGSYE